MKLKKNFNLKRENFFKIKILYFYIAFPCHLLFFFVFINCNNHKQNIFVLKNSYNIKYIKNTPYRGCDYVTYQIKDKYPANKTVSNIIQGMHKNGFLPLSNYYHQQTKKSSIIIGWDLIKIKTNSEFILNYSWANEWTNARGDFISYILEYNDSKTKLDLKAYYRSKKIIDIFNSQLSNYFQTNLNAP